MERRSQALLGMSKFGALAGPSSGQDSSNVSSGPGNNTQGSVRGTAASLLAPVFGLFRDSATGPSTNEPSDTTQPASKRRKKSPGKHSVKEPAKSPWMEEMENIEEETGLSCCVCQVRDDIAKSIVLIFVNKTLMVFLYFFLFFQEGMKNQPKALLGLYAYVKKVTVNVVD